MKQGHWRWAAVAAVSTLAISTAAVASHAWSNYHWKKTGAQVNAPVVTIVSGPWAGHVSAAVADWNQSTVIESPGPTPTSGRARQCRAQAGKIVVCNDRYGQNGWLGIASIWLSGGHISQGTTKLNDTYFNMPQYNTNDWRQLVACQEIGHDYGLGHQDENFSTDNTNSCMDYTSQPAGNTTPDAHDYQQLLSIYNHTESSFTMLSPGQKGGSSGVDASLNGAESGDGPPAWGRPIASDAHGRPNVYVQDLGGGRKKVTHVLWAIGEGPKGNGAH